MTAALPAYIPDYEIHSAWKKETRYDLDFGRRGRPVLHNSRYAACDVVDIHSGVRRALREPRAYQSTIALDRGNEAFSTCPEGHTSHAVVTDV